MRINNFLKRSSILLLILSIGCTEPAEKAGGLSNEGEKTDTAEKVIATPKETPANDFVLNKLLSYQSEIELKEAYGKKVTHGRDFLPEGMGTYPVTVLYAGTSNEVKINWRDTAAYRNINNVILDGNASDWQTTQGIRLGTRLRELEKLNGKPFTLYGFGWDYGGAVQWNGGKLDNQGIFVRLTMLRTTPEEGWNALQGDNKFMSNDSMVARADIVVDYISLGRK